MDKKKKCWKKNEMKHFFLFLIEIKEYLFLINFVVGLCWSSSLLKKIISDIIIKPQITAAWERKRNNFLTLRSQILYNIQRSQPQHQIPKTRHTDSPNMIRPPASSGKTQGCINTCLLGRVKTKEQNVPTSYLFYTSKDVSSTDIDNLHQAWNSPHYPLVFLLNKKKKIIYLPNKEYPPPPKPDKCWPFHPSFELTHQCHKTHRGKKRHSASTTYPLPLVSIPYLLICRSHSGKVSLRCTIFNGLWFPWCPSCERVLSHVHELNWNQLFGDHHVFDHE